jgi:hypothetical protein
MKRLRNLIPLVAIAIALFACAIVSYNSIRAGGRHYLTRAGLIHPRFGPWRRLLNYGDEGSFIEMTGLNFDAFRDLVYMVATEDERARRRRVGRPKLLNLDDEIGLFLFFVNSTMRAKHLSMIFGILPNTISITIRLIMKRIIRALKNHPDARIKFPNNQEMAHFAEMINQREPTVDDVIAFLDGVSLHVQCSDDPQAQAEYYNGYHSDTMVNNIFLFSPEGKIIYGVFNAPGSWHDSHVARPLVALVLEKIGNYKICVDQGFKRGGILFGKFVGPLSQKSRRNLSPILRREFIELHNKYVSLRQSSEWGMRALQGTFSRLKSRLTSITNVRNAIIYSIILLHNYRTSRVGLNQIAVVFNPHYEAAININGYDRIARYYDNELNYVD